MNVCICGGGSLGHVCAGVLGSHQNVKVRIFTRRPEDWQDTIDVIAVDNRVFHSNIERISANPAEVIVGSDIIFLCLPGYAIEDELKQIKSYIGDAAVGSIVCSTGFFFQAHKILGKNAKLFGFQRTPFIARTEIYGHRANLLGYKSEVAIAVENISDVECFRRLVEKLWITPCKLLNNYYEVSLTNSNPILHTGRLYSMWKDWNGEVFDHNILFYKEWTEDASKILINMDQEFMQLLDKLPVSKGAIPSLLEYYECEDAQSLRNKISSIPAFQNITSPMIKIENGWIPDFNSRYFTEDFPFGLSYIKQLAQENNVATPIIDKVFEWGMSKCNR